MENGFTFNYSIIAQGNQFIGREQEKNELIKGIYSGIKYSLYGQKRVGKTSLAFELTRILESMDGEKSRILGNDVEYKVAYCDCGTILTEKDLWKKILKGLDLEYDFISDEIDYFYISEILLNNINVRKLIILDEFQIIASNNKIPQDFYNFLRGISNTNSLINYMTISKSPIFDIEQLYDHLIGSPFFNIFTKYNLKALPKGEASKLLNDGLRNLLNGQQKLVDELIEYSGTSPFYLNKIGSICMKYAPISDNIETIKREFFLECSPFFEDMIKEYDMYRYSTIISAITTKGFMIDSILKRKFMEENIITDCEENKVKISSKALEEYILNKTNEH